MTRLLEYAASLVELPRDAVIQRILAAPRPDRVEIERELERLRHLEERERSARDDLVAARAAADELTAELGTSQEDVAELRDARRDLAERAARLEEDLACRGERIEALEGDLDEARRSIDGVEEQTTSFVEELAARDERVSTLEGEVEAARAVEPELVSLREQVEEGLVRATGLEEELAARDERVSTLEGELEIARGVESEVTTTLRRQLDESIASAAHLEVNLAARDERVAALEEELGNQTDWVTALEEELDGTRTVEAEMTALRGQLEEGSVQAAQLEEALARRDERVTTLEGELDAARERLVAAEAAVSSTGDTEAISAELDGLRGELAAATERSEGFEVSVREATDRAIEAERELDRVTLERHDATDWAAQLAEDLATRGERIEALEAELGRATERAEEHESTLSEVEQLRRALAEKPKLTPGEMELQALRFQLRASRVEADHLRRQGEDISSRLRTSDDETEALSRTAAELGRKLTKERERRGVLEHRLETELGPAVDAANAETERLRAEMGECVARAASAEAQQGLSFAAASEARERIAELEPALAEARERGEALEGQLSIARAEAEGLFRSRLALAEWAARIEEDLGHRGERVAELEGTLAEAELRQGALEISETSARERASELDAALSEARQIEAALRQSRLSVAEHAARVEEALFLRGGRLVELEEALFAAWREGESVRESRLSLAEHTARIEEDLLLRGEQVGDLDGRLAEASGAAAAATMRAHETGQQLAAATGELSELRERHGVTSEWAARLQEDLATRGERLEVTCTSLEEERATREHLEVRIAGELTPEIDRLRIDLASAENRLGELEEGEHLAAERGRHGRELIALRSELDTLVSHLRSQVEN